MAFTAGQVVNAASGLLFAALGAYLVVLAGRRRDTLLWAAFCIAFGASFIFSNFLRDWSARIGGASAITACYILASAALVGIAASHHRAAGPYAWLAWAASGAAATLAVLTPIPDEALLSFYPMETLAAAHVSTRFLAVMGSALLLVALLLALRYREAQRHGEPSRAWALAALGLAIYPTFARTSDADGLNGFLFWRSLPTVALALVVAAAWLAATRGPGGAHARNVAIGIAATAFLGVLELPIAGEVGIVRTIAAALLATAIFRDNLLGSDLSGAAARNGQLATILLATLFVVAQLAQNYLSAEYGLVAGGVVAGALLFAAQPIQRAFERTREGKDEHAREVYRRALRLALHDGALTAQEEKHLAEVADGLGLSHADAIALRHEVGRG